MNLKCKNKITRLFRRFNILLMILLGFLLGSCSKNELVKQNNNVNTVESSMLLKNGYLSFKTFDDFNSYLAELKKIPHADRMKKGSLKYGNTSDSPFISFAQYNWNIVHSSSKSTKKYESYLDDSLVPSSSFQCLLNKDLEIEVEGKLYNITQYGTFITYPNFLESLYLIIDDFNNYESELVNMGEGYYMLNDSVKIYDSFGYLSKNLNNIAINVDEVQENLKTTPIEHDNMYNIYTIPEYIMNVMSNGSYTSETYFDDNHRLVCKLWNFDYVVTKSSGFYSTMQEKFIGDNWFDLFIFADPPQMVIGIEELAAKYDGVPTEMERLSAVSNHYESFSGFSMNVLYKGVHQPAYVLLDVADEVPMFYFGNPSSYATQNQIDDAILSSLTTFTSQSSYYYPGNLLVGSPIFAAVDAINSTYSNTIYCVGNNKYTESDLSSPNSTKREYDFGNYGFPHDFDLRRIKIFGAGYYNNEWKGVRFTKTF